MVDSVDSEVAAEKIQDGNESDGLSANRCVGSPRRLQGSGESSRLSQEERVRNASG